MTNYYAIQCELNRDKDTRIVNEDTSHWTGPQLSSGAIREAIDAALGKDHDVQVHVIVQIHATGTIAIYWVLIREGEDSPEDKAKYDSRCATLAKNLGKQQLQVREAAVENAVSA